MFSLIRKGESSLESIGASFNDKIDQQSGVKKVKRFLQSKYTDCELLFFPFIRPLLAGIASSKQELVLVIDGTDLGKSCGALMLSVVWGKRALPLVWIVKKGNKGHFSVEDHVNLCQQVSSLLPDCEQIVLLGDGEFSSCELQAFAQSQHWLYVLRTAKNTYLEDQKGDFYMIGEVDIDPKIGYVWLENCAISKKKYGSVSALAWHQRKHKEPIYLLSNMDWAKDMMDYYDQRWSIETLFSDLKSRSFNIHKTRIKDPDMLHNLLIIVAIAFCLCLIIGEAKQLFNSILAKIIRKNKIKNYSIPSLGKLILRYCIENSVCFQNQLSKAFYIYFCVRF